MADWFVAPSGNDATGNGSIGNPYKTIYKAWSMASDNDTIYCSAGTYTETASLIGNKAISIKGMSSDYSDVIIVPTVLSNSGLSNISGWFGDTNAKLRQIWDCTVVFDYSQITAGIGTSANYLLGGYTTSSGGGVGPLAVRCFFLGLNIPNDVTVFAIYANRYGDPDAYKCTFRGFKNNDKAAGLYGTRNINAPTLTAIDCIFEDCSRGIGGNHVDVTIAETYNCFYNNTYNIRKATTDVAINASSISSNPEFTGAGVAALTAGSPCIDAGVVIPGYVEDYIGDAPDMGCDEAPLPYGFVPNLRGMTEAEAGAALIAAGFILGTSTEAYNDDYGAGIVYESWPTAGAYILLGSSVNVFVSLGSPLPGPASLRDMVLETAIDVINDGHAYEIAKQLQVIGDIVTQNDGTAEIELRSPMDAVLSAQIVNTHPAAPATVEYDAETVITVMADVILNSGKWLYKRFHYNDIAELHARFAGVWEAITLTTADLNGLTVGDILNLLGPCLGLCISQSGDGCIDIWHPGVYRGSRRTHYFSSSDCEPGGCQIVDRGRDGQYGGVRVDGAGSDITIYSLAQMPVEDGWRENIYNQEVPDDIFAADQTNLSATALARQLIQRLCEPHYDITLSMGLKGMQVDLGDTIVLESDALAATIPCLVTGVSTDIETGRTEINAVHYPNALGLHSAWEDDGVRGIWRWLDSDLDADYSNMGHNPLDADWTEIVSPAANRLSGHWQGSCSQMAAYNSSLLSATAEVSDLFDFGMILSGTSAGELRSPHGPTVSWADPDVGPLLAWVNADDSAMVLFWSVPGGGTGAESMLNNRLALGYTTDYTAGTIAWEWVYYLPFGSIGRTWQGTANGTRTAAAVALEWKDDTIRVYSERRLMLEVTETEADKADFTAATLYYNHASDDCYIGCFRHLRQSGWIEERQRIQGANGIDPYYGPDTL